MIPTAVRAAIALTLLAGVYVLVAAVVLTEGVLVVMSVHSPGPLLIGITVAMGVGTAAMLRAVYLVSRPMRSEKVGLLVSPAEQPKLWLMVELLSARVQTRPPDEIRLVHEVNAAVLEESSLLGLRPGTRVMQIGVPLLVCLSTEELRAVLGHEVAHYARSHARLCTISYRGTTTIARVIESLEHHRILRSFFLTYANLYLLVAMAVSRDQEYEADVIAASLTNRDVMSAALRKLHGAGAAWATYLETFGSLVGPAKARPADLLTGFASFVAQPDRSAALLKVMTSEDDTSLFDTHPSLEDRLEALSKVPDVYGHVETKPAAALLAQYDIVSESMVRDVLSDEACAFDVADWPEIFDRAMQARTAEVAQQVATCLQRIPTQRHLVAPTVGDLLQLLSDGCAHWLGARLEADGRTGPSAHTMLVEALTLCLIDVTVRAGILHWRFSWTADPVVVDHDDNEVGLRDWVDAAVLTVYSVQALIDNLAELDVDQTVPLTAARLTTVAD